MSNCTVMTFNVRYDTVEDGARAWPYRRALALTTIREHDPDLLGVQEPTDGQRLDIAGALSGWSPFGLAQGESLDVGGDYPCGFVRATRFETLDSGVFWLSDTPDVPESITWPNDWGARLCSWARLRDRVTNRPLIFASTHFDTNAAGSLPSARVLHGELDKVAGMLPIVVVGDFNCVANSDAHAYLCGTCGYRDAWNEAGHRDDGIVTFNGFSLDPQTPEGETNGRVDWILLRGPIQCLAAENDCRTERGLLPSDHYPVIAWVDLLPSISSTDQHTK